MTRTMNLNLTPQLIREKLFSPIVDFPSVDAQNKHLIAAVLLPLVNDQTGWHILFTKRTDTLPHHKGQISFPGGMAEDVDSSPLDSALRETEEELGVDRSSIRVLGRMQSFVTSYDLLIYPFVGILTWPQELNISRDEVSKVILIPIDWLRDSNHYSEKEYNDHPGVIFYDSFEGDILWGMTARMTRDFLDSLG
jgi:8-oxo-dGTP pyrophosphatase MutT (NUDIX family)